MASREGGTNDWQLNSAHRLTQSWRRRRQDFFFPAEQACRHTREGDRNGPRAPRMNGLLKQTFLAQSQYLAIHKTGLVKNHIKINNWLQKYDIGENLDTDDILAGTRGGDR